MISNPTMLHEISRFPGFQMGNQSCSNYVDGAVEASMLDDDTHTANTLQALEFFQAKSHPSITTGTGAVKANELNTQVQGNLPFGDKDNNMSIASAKSYAKVSPPKASTTLVEAPKSVVVDKLTFVEWKSAVVYKHPSEPSAELEHYLSYCEGDVIKDIRDRADLILESILTIKPKIIKGLTLAFDLNAPRWAKYRRIEVLKIYYMFLGAICTVESQVEHTSNLKYLLTNEMFHRCMLACSAELILANAVVFTVLFPSVLKQSGITAFDLFKVIESFTRHEELLSRELRWHLNALEVRILEHMAWEKGSSMYDYLIVARPDLSAEINNLGLLPEPVASLNTIAEKYILCGNFSPLPSLHEHETTGQNEVIQSSKAFGKYRSASKRRYTEEDRLLGCSIFKSKIPLPPLKDCFASPKCSNIGGAGETCAEKVIEIFFHKILEVAAFKIGKLVAMLNQTQHVKEAIYSSFEQILYQRTSLFFERHIDQIILCCVYFVAKISQNKLKFKAIIRNYKRLPYSNPEVVDWSQTCHNGKTGQDCVGIRTFYKEIFHPSVKPLLVDLGLASVAFMCDLLPEAEQNVEGRCSGSSHVSFLPSLPNKSSKKGSSSHSVCLPLMESSKINVASDMSQRSFCNMLYDQ